MKEPGGTYLLFCLHSAELWPRCTVTGTNVSLILNVWFNNCKLQSSSYLSNIQKGPLMDIEINQQESKWPNITVHSYERFHCSNLNPIFAMKFQLRLFLPVFNENARNTMCWLEANSKIFSMVLELAKLVRKIHWWFSWKTSAEFLQAQCRASVDWIHGFPLNPLL